VSFVVFSPQPSHAVTIKKVECDAFAASQAYLRHRICFRNQCACGSRFDVSGHANAQFFPALCFRAAAGVSSASTLPPGNPPNSFHAKVSAFSQQHQTHYVHHDTNCGMGYLGSKMIARSVISNHLRTVICGIHVIV
jgi:hypothetical protein